MPKTEEERRSGSGGDRIILVSSYEQAMSREGQIRAHLICGVGRIRTEVTNVGRCCNCISSGGRGVYRADILLARGGYQHWLQM